MAISYAIHQYYNGEDFAQLLEDGKKCRKCGTIAHPDSESGLCAEHAFVDAYEYCLGVTDYDDELDAIHFVQYWESVVAFENAKADEQADAWSLMEFRRNVAFGVKKTEEIAA